MKNTILILILPLIYGATNAAQLEVGEDRPEKAQARAAWVTATGCFFVCPTSQIPRTAVPRVYRLCDNPIGVCWSLLICLDKSCSGIQSSCMLMLCCIKSSVERSIRVIIDWILLFSFLFLLRLRSIVCKNKRTKKKRKSTQINRVDFTQYKFICGYKQ
jgi:hypothetical protein